MPDGSRGILAGGAASGCRIRQQRCRQTMH